MCTETIFLGEIFALHAEVSKVGRVVKISVNIFIPVLRCTGTGASYVKVSSLINIKHDGLVPIQRTAETSVKDCQYSTNELFKPN